MCLEINPDWKGAEACRNEIKTNLSNCIRHLFGDCDMSWCKHEATWKPRSGSTVDCPIEQAQIRQLLNERIFDFLDVLVLEDIGPVSTNLAERVGAVVGIYRRKGVFHTLDIEVQ